MFVKYAQKLVGVDATHGKTAYDFQLITVLVIDDYDEGIPMAWLISDREAADVLRVFYSSIRNICGDVRTETMPRRTAMLGFQRLPGLTENSYVAGTLTAAGAVR